MRIPIVYFESMVRRYKKSQQDTQDFSWLEANQIKPIIEQLDGFLQCVALQSPHYIKIIMDTLDQVFEAAVLTYRDKDNSKSLQLFGEEDPWNCCLKACEVLQQASSKQIDLFFGYENLLQLIIYNPDQNIVKIQKIIETFQKLFLQLNNSKACRYKIDVFEIHFQRFMYLNLFFQKSLVNLSNNTLELIEIAKYSTSEIAFTIPSDDQIPYSSFAFEIQSQRKLFILKQQSIVYNITQQSPLEQTILISQQYKIDNKSPLFDQIYVKLVCENSDKQILQQLYVQNYHFQLQIQLSDINIIGQKAIQDISYRSIDQKDFLTCILRGLNILQDQKTQRLITQALQYLISKQIILYDAQAQEKLQYFQLQIIQDQLIQLTEQLQLPENCPSPYQVVNQYSQSIQQIAFDQITESQFSKFFKQQPSFQLWINLILFILENGFSEQAKLVIPNYMVKNLLQFCGNLIKETSQIDYHLESQIIETIININKSYVNLAIQTKIYGILNLISIFYKQEYDAINLQNAQSEQMMPVPERYHKLLGAIWQKRIFENTLQIDMNEQLFIEYLSLLSLTLGENPVRVRQLMESQSLQILITKIFITLKDCSRGSPFIVTIINFLIAISTNDQAMQITLFNNEKSQDNMIQQIFIKCYHPSQELVHDPSVSDDFARKIIMLYSQSKMAKQQIEKTIESTFVILSTLVDLSKDKIEEIVSNTQKLQQFYTYSKSLQALLQLFSQLQPERRSYRNYQGYEDFQLDEAVKQKDQLFASLLKNNKFVEALEKIIMSPILIGSKNKDQYVEQYVTVLFKKNKLNPYAALIREMEVIQNDYMMINGVKVIDMGKLVDYEALSVHMSERYFFRKIIKHISPQTYRGFYILSRFHLIHYLIKMLKQQGVQNQTNVYQLVEQLLEIYFLSSQHAGFHEQIMMTVSIKQARQDEENQLLKRKVSKDSLIPMQQSCIEQILNIQTHLNAEQKEQLSRKYAEIVIMFLQNIQQRAENLKQMTNQQALGTITYIQDMFKSLKHLVKNYLTFENQAQPLQFLSYLEENKQYLKVLVTVPKAILERGQQSATQYLDAIVQHSETLIKDIFFKKIILDRIKIKDVWINEPIQLEIFTNEIIVSFTQELQQMIEIIIGMNESNQLKLLLTTLLQKFDTAKEFCSPENKKLASNQQLQKSDNELLQFISQVEAKKIEQKKQSIFERPEVKAVLDMVVNDMGFSERLAKKALRKIEVPEPTMIIDMLINGKVSDDEEEEEEQPEEDVDALEKSKQMFINQKKQLEEQLLQQQQAQQIVVIDQEKFDALLRSRFPLRNEHSQPERIQNMIEDSKRRAENLLYKIIDQFLLPEKQFNSDILIQQLKKSQCVEIILNKVFTVLHNLQRIDPNNLIEKFYSSLQWLNIIAINIPQFHEALYSHLKLVDQELPKQQYVLSMHELIQIGSQFAQLSFEHIKQQFEIERTLLQKEPNQQEIVQFSQNLTKKIQYRQYAMQLLSKELQLVTSYLTKFSLGNNQTHEQIIDRYWGQIFVLIQQLMTFLNYEIELKEINEQQQKALFQYHSQPDRVKPKPEIRPTQEKLILSNLMNNLNNYCLHNQNQVQFILCNSMQGQQKSLLDTLLTFKTNVNERDEEQYSSFLENLIYLLALDQKSANDIYLLQMRQAIIIEHCDWFAQQLKQGNREITRPCNYVESPLQFILATQPQLINNPLFLQNILDPNSPLSLSNKFIELQRTHAPKQQNKKEAQTQPAQPEYVLRWDIYSAFSEFKINKDFKDILDKLVQNIVDKFYEENKIIMENSKIQKLVDMKQVNVIQQRNNLIGWDGGLKILEYLLQKIPYLCLHLKDVQITSPIDGNQQSFINFMVKYSTWVGTEKLFTFLNNYLGEINIISTAYGIQLSEEIISQIVQEIDFYIEIDAIHKFYHTLQNLQLLIILLTSQNCSFLLCDYRSSVSIIPKLIKGIQKIPEDFQVNYPSLYRQLCQTLTKVLDPFLQGQVFYEYLKSDSKFGQLFKLQINSKDPFIFNYYTQLRNTTFSYYCVPSYKFNHTPAQQIISIPVNQQLFREDQVDLLWPPNQSKRTFNVQRQTGQKQVEEDCSASDSDQDIMPIQDIQQKGLKSFYTGVLGSNDHEEQYIRQQREDDRARFEININVWSQQNMNLCFTNVEQQYAFKFTLPKIIIHNETYYKHSKDQNQQRDWTLIVLSQYINYNEYQDAKRQLLFKFYDGQLRGVILFLTDFYKLMLINDKTFGDYENYYLSGVLKQGFEFRSTNFNFLRFIQQGQQLQDYQANLMAISSDNTFVQLKQLSSITCPLNTFRVLPDRMPTELYDQNIIKAKITSFIPSFEEEPAQDGYVDKVPDLFTQDIDSANDEIIINLIVSLIDESEFVKMPFAFIKQISRCQRIGTRLLLKLLELLANNQENLDLSLKILHIISQKIQQSALKSLLQRALEISPALIRRDKKYIGKGQIFKNVQELDEDETEILEEEDTNPLIIMIQLISTYSNISFCYQERFLNQETIIPKEKNILITPLLNNQTIQHVHYLVSIISSSLTNNEDNKEKRKDEDQTFSFLKQQDRKQFQQEERMRIYDMFQNLDQEHSNIFNQIPGYPSSFHANIEQQFSQISQGLFRYKAQEYQDKLLQAGQQPLQFVLPPPPPAQQSQLPSLQWPQIPEQPVIRRKVSAKVFHIELDIISLLCQSLGNQNIKEQIANDIVYILTLFSNDKYRVEHAIQELNKVLQDESRQYNSQLDQNRNILKDFTKLREKSPNYDPEQKVTLNNDEIQLIKQLNNHVPEPTVIQRVFQTIIGFLNASVKEETQIQPSSTSASQSIPQQSKALRASIANDKKKYSRIYNILEQQQLKQQGKKVDEIEPEQQYTNKDVRKLSINILQTQQTSHLWLNVVETLLLVFNFRTFRSLEILQKKLNPLLECFLKLYKNISEEGQQQLLSPDVNNFFERNQSGSTSLQPLQGILGQSIHLQRSFSSVRNDDEQQLKIDELFTYLCVNGKRIINQMMQTRLSSVHSEAKTPQGPNNIKQFKEQDPLGFVFMKMNQLISFENKKIFFEAELECIKLNDKPIAQRTKIQRPNEVIEFTIQRELRLQNSIDKVLAVDKLKFRKCDIKIKYAGEKGQDEGGIKKEWMTNLVKDILETDKFELNSKRFYRFSPNKKTNEDILVYKLLGRLLGKAIYDNQLLPAYLIPPIFRQILQKSTNFNDLEHFNEGYYDTYLKFINDDTKVVYKELFEFWIPEDYIPLIEKQKVKIFTDVLIEHIEKNNLNAPKEAQDKQDAKDQDLKDQKDIKELKEQKDSKDQKDSKEQKEQQALKKKQSEDLTKEEQQALRKKNREKRNNQKASGKIKEEIAQQIDIKELLSKMETEVPKKVKQAICQEICKIIMQTEVDTQLNALRDGFFEILPKELFSYLDWKDLQKLIIGVPVVDVDDLQQNTEYINYDPSHQTVIWFWEVLKTFSDSEKADFLMFATGSPLVPLGGFKNLKGPNGPKKFSIQKDPNLNHLIKSHTCFNRIDMPEYQSKEVVRDNLFKSLRESGQGFDLS